MKNPDMLEGEYKARAKSQVLLTVIVGDAQMGATAVWINETLHGVQEYNAEPLGLGTELDGKQIRVKTLVADINSFTNKMDVTYRLTGGQGQFEKTVPFEVDGDGDCAFFRAKFIVKT